MKVPAAKQRWWVWLPLLGLSAYLALGEQGPEHHAAAPSQPRAKADAALPPAPLASAAEALEPLAPRRPTPRSSAIEGGRVNSDLFSSRSWAPAPVAAPAAQPAEPPPLPFAYIGKKLDDGKWEVYLTRGEQSVVVREGQLVDNTYRVERIAPPTMTMVYVPQDHAQTLMIGEAR